MNARIITIQNPQDFEALVDATNRAEVNRALAYLGMWSAESYPDVEVWLDLRDKEIQATYKQDGWMRYLICGVWSNSDRRFSFHS